jgi:Uma2 family endonuclease
MLKTAPRPLTVHDYRELPEGPPYFQLIEGDLIGSPSPNRYHQDILLNLGVLFREYLKRNSVGRIYIAPSDVSLTDLNVYQPDLYFVSNARKSILSEQGAEGAPDLVVEILSPKTARFDKGVKREVYARAGVKELWIVNPELREIQVYHLDQYADVPVATYDESQAFEPAVLSGLRIPVARVFEQ